MLIAAQSFNRANGYLYLRSTPGISGRDWSKREEAGQDVTFTIDIGHITASSAPAFDVVMNDALPAGLELVPASVIVSGSTGLPPAVVTETTTQIKVYWTSFPRWNGNSTLTSHVYLANGLPGPFASLNELKYGDRIIIHAYGQKYTFRVSNNTVVEPGDMSAFRHEEKPVLTLITCKVYEPKTGTYLRRVVVRVVLVEVTAD